MKFSKKQKGEIFNCHIGAGSLIYKSSENEVCYVNILIKDGALLNANTGKPLAFNIYETKEKR